MATLGRLSTWNFAREQAKNGAGGGLVRLKVAAGTGPPQVVVTADRAFSWSRPRACGRVARRVREGVTRTAGTVTVRCESEPHP